jgi:hypothetical protein
MFQLMIVNEVERGSGIAEEVL